MKIPKWRWIVWLWVGWFFVLGVGRAYPARTDGVRKDITQKKRNLRNIKKEIAVTKEKEKEILGQESSVLDSLSRIDIELYRKEKELKQVEEQLVRTEDNLRQARDQLHDLGRGLQQKREELCVRLVGLYKIGRIETVPFTSHSYPDQWKMDKYLRVMIDSDARLIDAYRSRVSLKERYQQALMEDQTQWERTLAEAEKKRQEIRKAKIAKHRLLKSIQTRKEVYRKLIGELEDRSRKLQAFIDKLERERAEAAAEKSKSRPAVARGRLIPPVQGNVISFFRDKGQNGIEIEAPLGAEVRAVLPGKIVFADWFKGFGNVMIIDHGGQVFTVSGYCSELLKKAGEVVAQGETIARVGNAGSLKGPCLYFEIRHQGKPQDPREWISYAEKVASAPERNGQRKGSDNSER